jgi:hypothetical protein
MHRRLMVGLRADQGVSMAKDIASIAAGIAGWDNAERERQLKNLHDYNSRFRQQPD